MLRGLQQLQYNIVNTLKNSIIFIYNYIKQKMKTIKELFNESVKFDTTFKNDTVNDIMLLYSFLTYPCIEEATEQYFNEQKETDDIPLEVAEDVKDLINRVKQYCKEHDCEDWTY